MDPWRLRQIGGLNFSVLAQQGAVALRVWPKFLGVNRLPAGNRLERAIGQLERFLHDFPNGVGFDATQEVRARVVADSVRTVFEAFVVAFTVDRCRAQHRFQRKHFQAFLDGADFEEPGDSSDARSHQFEAYVLAQFILAGTSAYGAEPDILMDYHSEVVGIAVKRLRTRKLSGLNKRLRDGSSQIAGVEDGSARRGFLVLSVDPWLGGFDSEDDTEAVGRRFLEDLSSTFPTTQRVLVNRMHVRGVILTGTWMGWRLEATPVEFVWKAPQFFHGLTDSDEDEESGRKFDEFFEGWYARWTNALVELGGFLQSHPEV